MQSKREHSRRGRAVAVGGILAFVALAAGSVGAGETLEGPYEATVVEVVDGDTLRVRARVWLGTDMELLVRVDGIDAPELRGRCEGERALAVRARAHAESLVAGGSVRLRDVRYGKFAGRVVARVESGGRDLADSLIAAGLARAYRGGRRAGWC